MPYFQVIRCNQLYQQQRLWVMMRQDFKVCDFDIAFVFLSPPSHPSSILQLHICIPVGSTRHRARRRPARFDNAYTSDGTEAEATERTIRDKTGTNPRQPKPKPAPSDLLHSVIIKSKLLSLKICIPVLPPLLIYSQLPE